MKKQLLLTILLVIGSFAFFNCKHATISYDPLFNPTEKTISEDLGLTPFSVISSNEEVVKAALNEEKIVLTSTGKGTADISVFDKDDNKAVISVSVSEEGVIETEITFIQNEILIAQDFGFTPESVSSSNEEIIKAELEEGKIILTSVAKGSAEVTVYDEDDNESVINVTVAVTGIIKTELIFNPNKYIVSEEINLIPETVSSSKEEIVKAEVSEEKIILTSVAEGTAEVTVTDAEGYKAVINVNVAQTGVITTDLIFAKDEYTVTEDLGLLPEYADSEDVQIVKADVKNGKLVLSSVAEGTAKVTVLDKYYYKSIINVTVAQTGVITTELIFAKNEYTVTEDLGLLPEYADSENGQIVKAAVKNGKLILSSVAEGTAKVTVFDKYNYKSVINVTVAKEGKISADIIFTKHEYTVTENLNLIPHSVESTDAAIVKADVINGKVVLNSVAKGSAFIKVFDEDNYKSIINVTVAENGEIATVLTFNKDEHPVTENLGFVPYSVASSNGYVVKAIIQNGVLVLKSVEKGSSVVTAFDEDGHKAVINVTVAEGGEITTDLQFIQSNISVLGNLGFVPSSIVSGNEQVAAAAYSNGKIVLTSVGKGTANVNVFDNNGHNAVINATVADSGVIAAELIFTPNELTFVKDLSFTPVSAVSQKGQVVTASISNGKVVLTSVAKGTADINVSDNNGHKTVISTSVADSGVIAAELIFTPNELTVTGGLGLVPVSVVSSNEQAVKAVVSNGKVVLTTVAKGNATVNVFDEDGYKSVISTSVAESGIIAADIIFAKDTHTVTEDLGLVPYSVVSSNEQAVKAVVSNGKVVLMTVAKGTATVNVFDEDGYKSVISASVADNGVIAAAITFAKDTHTVTEDVGFVPYSVVSSNEQVVKGVIKDDVLILNSTGEGTAVVTPKAELGFEATINVSVSDKGEISVTSVTPYEHVYEEIYLTGSLVNITTINPEGTYTLQRNLKKTDSGFEFLCDYENGTKRVHDNYFVDYTDNKIKIYHHLTSVILLERHIYRTLYTEYNTETKKFSDYYVVTATGETVDYSDHYKIISININGKDYDVGLEPVTDTFRISYASEVLNINCAQNTPFPEDIIKDKGYILAEEDLPDLTDSEGRYNFKGWYIGESKVEIDEENPITITSTTTLTAKWEKLNNITFQTEYGTVPAQIPFSGSHTLTSAELPTLTSPSVEDFLGWYINGEKVEAGKVITEGTTLVAGWSKLIDSNDSLIAFFKGESLFAKLSCNITLTKALKSTLKCNKQLDFNGYKIIIDNSSNLNGFEIPSGKNSDGSNYAVTLCDSSSGTKGGIESNKMFALQSYAKLNIKDGLSISTIDSTVFMCMGISLINNDAGIINANITVNTANGDTNPCFGIYIDNSSSTPVTISEINSTIKVTSAREARGIGFEKNITQKITVTKISGTIEAESTDGLNRGKGIEITSNITIKELANLTIKATGATETKPISLDGGSNPEKITDCDFTTTLTDQS